MRLSFLLVLVLIALACDAKRKKKKKTSSSSVLQLKNILRGPKTTEPPKTLPKTTVKPAEEKNPLNFFNSINSTESFYKVFKNIPRLPQHEKNKAQISGNQVQETFCLHRQTLVQLPAYRYGEGFPFPACTWLSRCTGCCFQENLMTCKPTIIRMKSVQYYHIRHGSMPEQKVIEMEEHDKCSCQCKETADSCDPVKQDWDSSVCQCKCKDEFKSAFCDPGYKYDSQTCGCICDRPREVCAHHLKRWSGVECGCVCTNSCRPRVETLDPQTCNCESVHAIFQPVGK